MVLSNEERLERKRERDRLRNKSKISIGDCFQEWRQIATDKDLPTDKDVCRYLLDFYNERIAADKTCACDHTAAPISTPLVMPTSTPRTTPHSKKRLNLEMTPILSRSAASDGFSQRNDSTLTQCVEDSEDSEDSDDPSVNFSTLTTATNESAIYFDSSNIPSNQSIVESETVPDIKTLLVVEDNLLQLARMAVHRCSVKNCKKPQEVNVEKIGTACTIQWVCEDGHVSYKWHSQPQIKFGTYCGDMMFASSILLSGNNFEKIALFFRFMQMEKIVSVKSFNAIQKHLVWPVIEEYWTSILDGNTNKVKDKALIVCGDGRNDSPGHSAQYCTYTVMDHDTLDILSVQIVDKRHANLCSTNMERLAFSQFLSELHEKGLNVVEVVTDQHPGIIGLMKRDYPRIKHSFDIWHVAKNLGKRATKRATHKDCKDLLPWVRDIVRHFWWVTKECNGDVYKFKEMWRGVLHHIQGRHEWIGFDGSTWHCKHDENFNEREDLLKPGTPAFKAAQSIVLETRFLKLAPYFVNFRKTGTLETFQQLILKYCSKRHAYSDHIYRARNFLAAIDYSQHQDREYAYTRDNRERLTRKFNKRTKRWMASQRKKEKTYPYAKELMCNVFIKKKEFEGSLTKPTELRENDPRRIAPTIASVLPEATEEIWRKQISRF